MDHFMQPHPNLQEVGPNNAHLPEELHNPPIIPQSVDIMNPLAALAHMCTAMCRIEKEKAAADAAAVATAAAALLTLQQGPIDLSIKRQVDNSGDVARNGDGIGSAGVVPNYDQRQPVVPYAYGQVGLNDNLVQQQPLVAIDNGPAAVAANANFNQPRQFWFYGNKQIEFNQIANFVSTQQVYPFGRVVEFEPNSDLHQRLEAYGCKQVVYNSNWKQLLACLEDDEGRVVLKSLFNLIPHAIVPNINVPDEIGLQAQLQQHNMIAAPAPAVAVQALGQPGYGPDIRQEAAQVEGQADEDADGRHARHLYAVENVEEKVKFEIKTEPGGSPFAAGYDVSDEMTQEVKDEFASYSDPDKQNYVSGASDNDSKSLDSANGHIPEAERPSDSETMNGSVSPPVDDPVVDVVNHDPAILDGQNLPDFANGHIPEAERPRVSDFRNGSVSPPVDDPAVDVVNDSPAILDGQNLLDSTNDSIPVEERLMASDARNGRVSPPLDVQAEVKVVGPAMLADEAIVVGHAQAIQANIQVNDGTGEENDDNVPPNGVQAGARVDSIVRILRDRKALKRPAVFQAGANEDVPRAKKGRHYLDLLLYRQNGLYVVKWSGNDWSKYPTTCLVANVDQGREVVRFDNHFDGFNLWLDYVNEMESFQSELKSVREMAEEVLKDSKFSRQEDEDEDEDEEEEEDEEVPLADDDLRTEFLLLFGGFTARFWGGWGNHPAPNSKRIPFSAQNETWFKYHLFSYKCYLERLNANDEGDDYHYGFRDLHNICEHMGQYDRIEDFDEEVQTQRRALGLNLS